MKRNTLAPTLLLVLCPLLFLFPKIDVVKASGIIYIRSDGSVDPTTAPVVREGDVYSLTSDIAGFRRGIAIERDNIMLNGSGHRITGLGMYIYENNWDPRPSFTVGIEMKARRNMTIINVEIVDFYVGVFLDNSSNIKIAGCNITGNRYGCWLLDSEFNLFSENNMNANGDAIILQLSSDNSVIGNNITDNSGNSMNFQQSPRNHIYHNNFVNNSGEIMIYDYIFKDISPTEQWEVKGIESVNVWDDGSKGNYWSRYNGTGTAPYVIDAHNEDHHPLLIPYEESKESSTWLVPATIIVVVAGVTLLVYFSKVKKKTQNNEFAETQKRESSTLDLTKT